jgi:DNA replication protein DnaC
MSATDIARLPLLCTELRLPSVGHLWPAITEQADRDGWPAARTLAALFEHEVAERAQRRTQRHLAEARLPVAQGDTWLETGTNILAFGPPGTGKSHLAAALGHALVEAGYRVLFTRTTDLVQQLQTARQELKLAGAIEKLDKYHLIVLDDLSYLQKNQAETSVLFELISARYERRSIMITANQPFGAWDQIFPDPAMTIATIDRLVHHSIIFEMNTDSYRRRTAQARKPE